MALWMRDPEVSGNVGLTHEPSLERARDWIERALAADDIWPFAIHLDQTYVGNVVLDRVDRRLRSARLSVYIGVPEARGRGVGSTAISHVLPLSSKIEVFSKTRC